MIVLAIDPGPEESAWLTWNGKEILGADISTNGTLLFTLPYFEDTYCLIEMVESYGMPVGRDVFETVFWIGQLYRAWVERHYAASIRRIPRGEIKLHHCHSRRAKDSNIRAALIDKYGKPGTKENPGLTYGLKKDLWAAFALATYWTETHK